MAVGDGGVCETMVALTCGQPGPDGIAVDAHNVYFTNLDDPDGGNALSPGSWAYFTGSIVSVPIDGGPPVVLANYQDQPQGIAVDSSNVYWTNQTGVACATESSCSGPPWGSVWAVPLDGGLGVDLVNQTTYTSSPYGVVSSSGALYWINSAPGTVFALDLDGGATPREIASTPSCQVNLGTDNVVVNSSSIYWTSVRCETVMTAPLDGGPTTALASVQAEQAYPQWIAIDSTNAYWTNTTETAGFVMSVPLDGGVTTQLASGQDPTAIVADGMSIYWADEGVFNGFNDSGAVMKYVLDSGTLVKLAGGLTPGFVALDVTSVYWTDASGCVFKVTPK